MFRPFITIFLLCPIRNAVLSFAVESLRVKHVVVLGHYGCGGVAESMMPLREPYIRPADIAVQAWILPIRQIYWTSTRCVPILARLQYDVLTPLVVRAEIVAHREKCKYEPMCELPHLHDRTLRFSSFERKPWMTLSSPL